MVGMFPTVLLVHAVRVYRRTTTITNGAAVESTTLLGTAGCLISEVSANRGQNDQDGVIVQEAVLSGTNPLLSEANVWFQVVKGPFPANIELFPVGGQSPHGAAGGIRQYYRFRVSTVAVG